MLNKFLEWIGLKEKLHAIEKPQTSFKEGDVWWCAVGENIGIEINGKNEPFSRPVFIYRKLSRFGFMSVPLSTKIKNGSWYVDFVFQDKKITANLAQARVMSSQRLYNKQGELSAKDTKRIKDAFIKLYS